MILVFAGKRVGRELVYWLRQRGDPITITPVPQKYDWILNLWSPKILPKEVLGWADHRANLHPSLVPHARGSDSAAWTIRKGLQAGVSILEMTETVDGGGVYAQRVALRRFPITGRQLNERLQDEAIELFKECWPRMQSGDLVARPQPEGGSYHTRKDTNADRVQSADARMTLVDTVDWMLAHDFYPGTTAEMAQNGQRFRLRLSVEQI